MSSLNPRISRVVVPPLSMNGEQLDKAAATAELHDHPTGRPGRYRPGMTSHDAITEMCRPAGSRSDPQVVALLCDVLEQRDPMPSASCERLDVV